jgi:HSP20 family protein
MNLKSILPFGEKRGQAAPAELSPFATLQREIDRVFADFARGWPTFATFELTPRIDVTERENHLEITAELPGLEEKDVDITLANDILTIRGEKTVEKEENDETRRVTERSYGAFCRSIELPAGVKPDDIKASMAKGVLTVALPKPALPQSDTKKIAIQAAA